MNICDVVVVVVMEWYRTNDCVVSDSCVLENGGYLCYNNQSDYKNQHLCFYFDQFTFRHIDADRIQKKRGNIFRRFWNYIRKRTKRNQQQQKMLFPFCFCLLPTGKWGVFVCYQQGEVGGCFCLLPTGGGGGVFVCYQQGEVGVFLSVTNRGKWGCFCLLPTGGSGGVFVCYQQGEVGVFCLLLTGGKWGCICLLPTGGSGGVFIAVK